MPTDSAPTKLESQLQRWVSAGVLDQPAADRVRSFENQQGDSQKLRWPVILALSFGGVLLAAGVLLFVAAHWEELSPSDRFALVLLLVALFHLVGAAAAGRFAALSRVVHAVATITLGAGIFLAAQIFNLAEHWPSGFLLWAIGAALGWAILRDWVQGFLVTLLVPVWMAGEWIVFAERHRGGDKILCEGLLLLAISYISATIGERPSSFRRALAAAGELPLIPLAITLTALGREFYSSRGDLDLRWVILGWTLAFSLPLLVALLLRGRAAWINLVAAVWVLLLGTTSYNYSAYNSPMLTHPWDTLGPYILGALGSVGLVAWGLFESRRERINLGVASFALTVLIFYFSSVMDKLGRSASLIGMGLLFLLGGWGLEKMRRRLVARVGAGS